MTTNIDMPYSPVTFGFLQRYADSGARSLVEFSEMEMARVDADWRRKTAVIEREGRLAARLEGIPLPDDASLFVRAKEGLHRIYDSLMGN